MHIPACKYLPLVASVVFVVSCSRQPASFVARVGDETITEEIFRAEAVRRHGSDTAEAKAALLDEMTRELKLLHQARQKGYDRDPEILREQRALLIARARDDFKLGAETEDTGPTPAELEACYQAHREEFRVPARVQAAMIFVATPGKLNAEALAERREKIESARRAIVAEAAPPEAPFGALALTYSEHQASRYVGGALAPQVEGMTNFSDDPAAVQALFALHTPGQLSEVVTAPSGFYLFKLLQRNDAAVQPLSAEALATIPAESHPEKLAAITLPTPRLSAAEHTPPRLPAR